MDPVFKKMNFKNQPEICMLNAPESCSTNLEAMQDLTGVQTEWALIKKLHFGLAFVTKQALVTVQPAKPTVHRFSLLQPKEAAFFCTINKRCSESETSF